MRVDQAKEVIQLSEDLGGVSKDVSADTQTLVQRHKEIQRRILELAARDSAFRAQLVDNPRQALRQAGLAEDVEAFLSAKQEADVVGHCYEYPYQYTW